VTGNCGPCQTDQRLLLESTTDGGRTWYADHVPAIGDDLGWSISFVDTQHGWIATSGGKIFATHDGAQTWVLQYQTTATK
jgi:photosystem II stability/assembly factor-like uncharacterized protein